MGFATYIITNRLIEYGHEIISAYKQDENISIALVKSHVHNHIELNIHCELCATACANRIAVDILAHASSEFNFKELKIRLMTYVTELGLYEFDGDKIVFRNTIHDARPYSLLEDESYCNKVEEKCSEIDKQDVNDALRQVSILREELKMEKPVKIVFNGGVIFASTPTIEKIHISGPCTVIIWSDKTKTMVRLQDGEPYDEEKAVYAAIAKKFIGTNKSKSNWLDIIREKMPDEQHNYAFYGVEKSDVKYVKQLLNSIYGAHKDEIEELRKAFEEGNDDTTETNGLTDSEPDISTDDCVSDD